MPACNQSITLLGLLLFSGCHPQSNPETQPSVTIDGVGRDKPEQTPTAGQVPGVDVTDIPTVMAIDQSSQEFRVRINREGEIVRNGQPTTKSDLAKELLEMTNIEDIGVLIEGNSDVRVGTVSELQKYLGDSVPGLGSVTYVVLRETDDEK